MGMIVTLVGAAAIAAGDFQVSARHLQGDAIALFGAIFMSAYLLLVEQLRARRPATLVLLGSSLVATLTAGVYVLGLEQRILPTTGRTWLAVLALALLSQIFGQGLIAFSLNRLSSGVVAIAFLLEPVVAAIAGWIIFGERLSWFNGGAFVVVLWGVYLAIASGSAIKASSPADQEAAAATQLGTHPK
ncbi:MAG: DMT family transporter [Chloroflexaceae bacterium]|nr:DMT family transporter [Chloroflexaceae bacterium]